ncbi:DUF4123 domain-containing protein, partial [Pseudophaeobacter sp.]
QQQNVQVTIETVPNIVPLDDQFGVSSYKTVPDPLCHYLLGPSDAHDALMGTETFALLDAAKVPALSEFLETSGLQHRCLFTGAAYDELKDVAPWLVRLEEGNSFSRNLFTRSNAPWHLWDSEPGLYLRSLGTLDQLWRHLRKFTRVQDEAGKWFYFRFWETDCLIDYIRYANDREGGDLRFLFGFDPLNPSLSLVRAYVSAVRDRAQICTVSQITGHKTEARTDIDMPVLRFLALRGHAHRFVESYFEGQGLNASAPQLHKAKNIAIQIAQKYHSFGFKSRYHLGSFIYWALALNADFETRTQVIKDQIQRTDADPNDRFVVIAREMRTLFGPKIRNYGGHGT